MTDQTDQRDANTKRDQAAYESDLISIVVHDLKSPVSAARGFIDLVEQTGPLNDRQLHFIRRAQVALTRMEHLIASLLDFSRLETGAELEVDEVNLRELIHEAIEFVSDVAEQREIKVHAPPAGADFICNADRRFLSHVFNNLLSNAVKYNRDGGEVWITVIPGNEHIQVDVKDTGIGIPEKAKTRIFERFYRAHKEQDSGKIEGTGLGLAIAQMIVELHQGKIWLESTPGEGTTFSFTLPLTLTS